MQNWSNSSEMRQKWSYVFLALNTRYVKHTGWMTWVALCQGTLPFLTDIGPVISKLFPCFLPGQAVELWVISGRSRGVIVMNNVMLLCCGILSTLPNPTQARTSSRYTLDTTSNSTSLIKGEENTWANSISSTVHVWWFDDVFKAIVKYDEFPVQ